jgi:TRAP-type C4-dicarboxylate transport system permease large subunit
MFRKERPMIVQSYLVYLAITLIVTVWVAHTLHRNGRVFLVDAFHGNDALADSVNHLLVVGFYLINVGYIALVLRSDQKPNNLMEAMEIFSHKIGVVLLVLGVMHFINLKIFSTMRQRAQKVVPPPPVEPTERTVVAVNG